MCMINKIGTMTITLSSKPMDQKMIDKMTRKRPPLTPDLFPYYAGTWEDDYDDYYYDENGNLVYYADEVVDLDNDASLESGQPNQDTQFMDYDEIYRDELEAINQPKIEDLNKISSIVEEVEAESSKVESLKNDPIYDELTKKLDSIDNQINDIHHQKFNDIKIENKKDQDKTPTISVSEKIVIEKQEEPVLEKEALSNTPSDVETIVVEKLQNDSLDEKYKPKFVVKANEKNNYYEDVLEIVNAIFNESK